MRLRPEIAAVPPYQQGRPAPQGGFKLSSNENPFPPLDAVVEAVQAEAERVNRYPRPGAPELRQALAQELGVDVERVLIGDGSATLIQQLIHAVAGPGDEVVYAWRSFDAYPLFVRTGGATPIEVPVDAEHKHDLDAMAAAITERTKVVVVCTPNNPTGPAVTRRELEEFLAKVPPHVLVVVDEAYREFVRIDDPVDAVDLYRDRENVVVMRTFAKAYGLAGFRVGYAVAPAPVAAAIRACALPFGVSSVAQAAAVASLEREAELLERVDGIVAERERVVAALRDQGFDVPDAQGNFVWLALGDRTLEFAQAAEEAGVMVRPFAGDGARVSIGEPAGNDVLLSVTPRFA